MKIISVSFPDTTDVSSLTLGATVPVGTVPGGTVVMIAQIADPPASVSPAHTHALSTSVTGTTGPAQ